MIHRGCSQPRRSLSHEGSVRLRCGRKRGTVKTCLFFSLYHARTASLHEPSGLLLADLGIGDWFGGLLFSAGPQANEAVQNQLSALSFSSLAVIFGAGLVTSLSLCTVGVLPLTLVYI